MDNEIDRAESLIQAGMYGEAIEILNRILHEEPDNIEAIRSIGIAYTEYNEPMRARKALDYFFLFREDDPQALEAYGCACFKMGEYERSGTYLEKAEKIMPESASIKRNLGVAYNQTGRKQEAYDRFKQSYELNPEDYRTEYALAMAHISFHEYLAAEELLLRMLSRKIPTEFRSMADESYRWVKHKLER